MTQPIPPSHAEPLICRQCRGLCCQGHPGVWVDPWRFFHVFKMARPTSSQALAGLLPATLVVREIEGVAIPAPLALPTGCVFLGDNGCQLPGAQRPDQCLALIPSLDTLIDGEIRCQLSPSGSTLQAVQNWQVFWAQS